MTSKDWIFNKKMVNEDILTALRNAIEHGESLQSASGILINSGYNAREVQEASVYMGTGVIIQERANEQLVMPANKSAYNPRMQQPMPVQQIQNPIPQKPNYTSQDIMQIKQEISSPLMPAPAPRYQQAFTYQQPSTYQNPQPPQSYPSPSYYNQQSLSNQLSQIGPRKSYTKEIVLLIILLILIAILIGTILFRGEIINFFSQMVSG